MRIGFIGIGDQGAAMARALLEAGASLTVWARRPEAGASLCEAGAHWSDTPATLGAAADLVALCVTDEAAIREILFGKALLASMRPASTLAIHSTIAPATIEELSAEAAGLGVRLLDAPVSGSGLAVAHRRLLMLVGGNADAAETLTKLYGSFCNPIIQIGSVGAATRLKLINNLKCAVDYALADQAMKIAQRQGLDTDVARTALLAGTGRSFALEAIERIVREERGEHVAAILAKDVQLALNAFGNSLPYAWPNLAIEGVEALRCRARERNNFRAGAFAEP